MKHINSDLHRRLKGFCEAAIALVAVILLASGCSQKPTLTGLDPTSGPPGTVVEVQGSNLSLAGVRWNANMASEQSLPHSFLAASFFSVPMGASIGPHPVRLFGGGEYSDNTVSFDVTAGTIRPQPRLDDVTVSMFGISGNKASMILMAHGANIDVGAQILVNGVAQDTFFSRLLRNPNVNATDPATLGYPIFHYATVWAVLSDLTPGADISVSIENLDGEGSNVLAYSIAGSMDTLDSDGDGLLDDWEANGYDADGDGTVDIDLPSLGADPMRKDLFVECDWMNAAAPNAAIWADVEAAFANAPILNTDGSQGIVIHIDRGQAGAGGGGGTVIAYADFIRYDNATPNPTASYTNFYAVKTNNFDPDRLEIYRYCVFAWDNGHFPGSSGQAEAIWANDFFVSLGNWGANGSGADVQTGTFVHELGHTLSLRHGGFENTNYKPNYNSIMTYGGGADWSATAGRCQRRFQTPGQLVGIDTDCNLSDDDDTYTYSQGMRAALNENALDEAGGVCDGVSINWDRDGNPNESNVSMDINCDGNRSALQDYADWANIELNFRAPGSGWGNN